MSEGDPKKRAKVKRAAEHPDRPGEECKAEPGVYEPAVDRGRCEGKGDCVDVCPYEVFEVRRIEDEHFAGLSFLAKVKSVAHGRKTAYVPRKDACKACGLCVVACPEKAITATRVRSGLLRAGMTRGREREDQARRTSDAPAP